MSKTESMEKTYAILPYRIKAAFIDSVVMIALMYGISELFGLFEQVPDIARAIAAIFIFLLYDPLFTSIYGGTIGHSFSGIEVKQQEDITKNISFPAAIARFLCKALLGWISLLTVTGNEKKQALHDLLVKSVVLEEKKETETIV
jgi:uncharacterized RDD family membrane protein YckC